jgi:hypothetical protein
VKYNSELTYEISYYDPRLDDMIQVHTDSLATAVIALITRSRRYPKRRIDLCLTGKHKLLGSYQDDAYCWQCELDNPDWQRYIDYKLDQGRIRL